MMLLKKQFILLLTLTIISSFTAFSQDDLELSKKDSTVVSSWILGIGMNVVSDSGDAFNNLFEVKETWNAVPYPSRLSIGRYFKNGLGVEAIAAYNIYKEGKRVDRVNLTEDKKYYSFDTRLSYDLNKIIGQTGWFDPYIGVGIGYSHANDISRGTYNGVLGFRTWFSDRFGLDISSTGKWAMNSDATNHIQHAVGVIYQFDIEKDLTRKGKEKLALIEALEKENARVNDSIANAKKEEERAKLLAEQMAREKENARLAQLEKDKIEKRQSVQNDLDALGNVYFDLNSSYLNNDTKKILDKLAELLEVNKTLILKVSSYTDSRGKEAYNQWLSERRVNNTVGYLVEKGISNERLKEKANGENGLLNECNDNTYCRESKHKVNRRSEFSIVNF
tara:strand:+ start:3788 stop:4963 length:1176 start_codon:yes stop_codon:yes gene_type:complete